MEEQRNCTFTEEEMLKNFPTSKCTSCAYYDEEEGAICSWQLRNNGKE
jgi:hypothetical protein